MKSYYTLFELCFCIVQIMSLLITRGEQGVNALCFITHGLISRSG